MRDEKRSPLLRYGFALAAVGLATLLRLLLSEVSETAPIYLLFLGAVFFASWYGGTGSGLLATGASAVAVVYFFVLPRFHFWPVAAADALGLLLFVAESVAIALVVAAGSRARSQLDAEREWLQVTLASIGDAVISTDAEGRVSYVNPVAASLTGWSPEEARGRRLPEVLQVFDETTGRALDSPAERVIRSGETAHLGGSTVLVRRDGSRVPIEDSAAPVRDRHGPVLGAVLVFRDVTERRQAQAALRQSESRLRRINESGMIGILFAEISGAITEANDTFLSIVGYGRDDLEAGRLNWVELTPPELLGRDGDSIAELLRRGVVAPFEKEYLHRDGRRVPVLVGIALLEGSLHRTVAVVLDLTARKRMEEELRGSHDRLLEADRRKDEFLAMLAHELRNPMAPVLSALEVIRLRGEDEAVRARALELATRQARHMARLVDDLLDVSRITRGKIELRRERVDLTGLAEQAVEAVRPLLEERRHSMAVSLPGSPVWLLADPARIQQVLANLLHNAAKYTEPGGRIALVVEPGEDEVTVRVRDTGAGIPRDMLPRIFDLFSQVDPSLDRSQGGLGIGLTLVRSLVELHGGTVQAFSEGPGRGSELVVRLPVLRDEGAAPGGKPESPPERGEALRVLVVEDNLDAAAMLCDLLRLWGHDVRVTHDGLEALEEAARYRPEVVLLDIGLPGMNGYELAVRLRQREETAGALLAAITGYGQERDIERAWEAGFDRHFTKPVDPGELRGMLAEVRKGP